MNLTLDWLNKTRQSFWTDDSVQYIVVKKKSLLNEELVKIVSVSALSAPHAWGLERDF